MKNNFYSFLISCFIISVISCGKTTEEGVNDSISKTNESVFGGSDGQTTSAGDESPTMLCSEKLFWIQMQL